VEEHDAGRPLTKSRCRFLARKRPANNANQCPKFGVKQTYRSIDGNVAIDPGCVKTHTSAKCGKYDSPTPDLRPGPRVGNGDRIDDRTRLLDQPREQAIGAVVESHECCHRAGAALASNPGSLGET
jgi:hypothetical protein